MSEKTTKKQTIPLPQRSTNKQSKEQTNKQQKKTKRIQMKNKIKYKQKYSTCIIHLRMFQY